MTAPGEPEVEIGPPAAEYANHLLAATSGAFEALAVYVGDRLGFYRGLVVGGPATASELAERTGTQSRYVREWLEHQASQGTVTVDDVRAAPEERRFALPPGPREVLTDEHSLFYLQGLPQLLGAVGPQLPALIDAYRDGGGVSWQQLGDDAREAQSALNRPWFETRLGPALAGVGDLHAALGAPGAHILDVGCGTGWSTLALARAYPQAHLVGVDVDAPSLASATQQARDAGLAERVRFLAPDGKADPYAESYDAAFFFECLHDMPDPVSVLSKVRTALATNAPVVVMDEAVADTFTAPGDEVDQLMYGFSLFVCLPDSLAHAGSVGTGTAMRRPVLEQYARAAGYSDVEVLPIEDFGFFRFYRLSAAPG